MDLASHGDADGNVEPDSDTLALNASKESRSKKTRTTRAPRAVACAKGTDVLTELVPIMHEDAQQRREETATVVESQK